MMANTLTLTFFSINDEILTYCLIFSFMCLTHSQSKSDYNKFIVLIPVYGTFSAEYS